MDCDGVFIKADNCGSEQMKMQTALEFSATRTRTSKQNTFRVLLTHTFRFARNHSKNTL